MRRDEQRRPRLALERCERIRPDARWVNELRKRVSTKRPKRRVKNEVHQIGQGEA
jgi:hypothetical protein